MSSTFTPPTEPKTKAPAGPRPRLPFGALRELRRDRLGYLQHVRDTYGPVATIPIGPRKVYLMNEPDMIREVFVTKNDSFTKSRALQMAKRVLGEGLLTSEGAFHRRQRRLSQPAFHKQRVAAYADVMAQYAQRISGQWRDGAQVDMNTEMMRLTLAVVAKTLFDADVEEEAEEIGEALTDVMELFDRVTHPAGELLNKLPLPSNFRFDKAGRRLDETIYRMIENRRKSGEDRGDLLSMLLKAQDEDDGSTMTDKQVRDEAITLFLAGHETTAILLTWMWYALSQHPDVEQKLHAELDQVLAGRLPTYDDMAKLPYTRQVVSETLRLYPPAYAIGRMAAEDVEIGGYPIPKNDIILICPLLMHRDARFYESPETWNPDRWTPAFQEHLHKFAFIPFGGGPRICIGESFAWMEAMIIMGVLCQKWRASHVDSHEVGFDPKITLRPTGGMPMVLHGRG